MQTRLQGLLAKAFVLCACMVAAPQGGRAQTGAYFTIPSAAPTGCTTSAPTPYPSAALYQITNAGGQATAGTLALYDSGSSCSGSPIWGPAQLGAGQTIVFGTLGIPLVTGISYALSAPPGTTIVLTW